MSKQLCIAALHHFEVGEPLGRGDQISQDIFLTNDMALVRTKITEGMWSAFGSVEMNSVISSGLVAYRLVEVEEHPSASVAEHSVLTFLRELKMLQMALWLARDNAASVANVFLQWHAGSAAISSVNRWGEQCTMANGTEQTVVFSREELRLARRIHSSIWKGGDGGDFRGAEPTEPDIPRFHRALYFLQGARQAPALSLKVAFYCSAFEALLSTETTELAHKLAQRLAWIISDTAAKRGDVFRCMKRAYVIRSRAVHGGALTKKKIESELLSAAKDCDDLLRALFDQIVRRADLRAVYIDQEASVEELEEVLVRITLGESQEPQTN